MNIDIIVLSYTYFVYRHIYVERLYLVYARGAKYLCLKSVEYVFDVECELSKLIYSQIQQHQLHQVRAHQKLSSA